MKQQLFLLLSIVLLFGCGTEQEKSAKAHLPAFGPLSTLPDAFSRGCRCWLGTDSTTVAAGIYLFVNDNYARPDGTGAAVVQLNGVLTQLNRTSVTSLPQGSQTVYKAEGYTLTVDLTITGSATGTEPVPVSAKLTLQAEEGSTTTITLTGWCGC